MRPSKLHCLRMLPWGSRGGSKTRQWKVTFGNVTTWGEKTNKYMEDTDVAWWPRFINIQSTIFL